MKINNFLHIFIIFLSSLQILIAQPCSFSKPKIYDLAIAESGTGIDFSPIDSNKLWIRNEYRTESYELDIETGNTISLAQKFGLSKSVIYDFDNMYVDSVEQIIWMGMSDFLISYDIRKKTNQHYEIGRFIDFFPTKDNIFFLGEKGVFVYQRKNKTFSTIFPDPIFRLLGLCKNTKSDFIFINPNTYIVEESLKIHYCTDENFEIKPHKQNNFDLIRVKKEKLKQKTEIIFGSLLEPTNAIVEDAEGFWKATDRVVAFYEKKTKDIYFTTTISDLKYDITSDACNFYAHQAVAKKLLVYPKSYLRSIMKKLDAPRFEKEKQVYDTFCKKQIWNIEDCTFDEFQKQYYTFKKQYIDTAYNFTVKKDLERNVSSFFGYLKFSFAEKLPILLKTTEKAIEEGRFPEEFGDLPKLYIRRLARDGEFSKAWEKYELYKELYKKTPLFKTNEDVNSITAIKNAILFAKKFDNIKSPDSILWFKSTSLMYYRMESPWEIQTRCDVFQPIMQLIKECPNSPLVEHCEYRLFFNADIRGNPHSYLTNFPDFYVDTVALYQNFLLKYPQSIYRYSVLSMLINYNSRDFEKESRIKIKQNNQYALRLINELNYEFPNKPFSKNEKKQLEDRIEYYSWEGEIKLSQTSFLLNQPIPYTIRLKNISKAEKKIQSIGCNKHPEVRLNIMYDDNQVNWNGNIVSFCMELEPPKCPESYITFLPKEEKIFQGILEYIPLYSDKIGTLKLLKKGNYKIKIGMNGLLDEIPFEFKIE